MTSDPQVFDRTSPRLTHRLASCPTRSVSGWNGLADSSFKILALALAVLLFVSSGCQIKFPFSMGETIVIDSEKDIAPFPSTRVGINVNFLLDGADEGPTHRSLLSALKQMGVRSLRFPGGEDSDAYLWSIPPFLKSHPALARTGPAAWPANDDRYTLPDKVTLRDTLDFDEFMILAKQLNAEPILVVCYDSMYKEAEEGGMAPTREQLLETAVQWVHYANVTKDYGIKYWEIGNESYLHSNNGSATAYQYASDLQQFSDAMKAVDPDIRIGASGLDMDWWAGVLPYAASKIDFLSVHVYPVWGWASWEYYRRNRPQFAEPIENALRAIRLYAPAEDRQRLRIAVTEANVGDWSPDFTWENVNDLGHALVAFDLFGQLLSIPIVDFIQFWTTKWEDDAFPPSVYTALSSKNELHAIGRAIGIWGKWSGGSLVATDSEEWLRAYASILNHEITVFILNKDDAAQSASINFKNLVQGTTFQRWIFKGNSPTDIHPTLQRSADLSFANPLTLSLDPMSITVLTQRREKE